MLSAEKFKVCASHRRGGEGDYKRGRGRKGEEGLRMVDGGMKETVTPCQLSRPRPRRNSRSRGKILQNLEAWKIEKFQGEKGSRRRARKARVNSIMRETCVKFRCMCNWTNMLRMKIYPTAISTVHPEPFYRKVSTLIVA